MYIIGRWDNLIGTENVNTYNHYALPIFKEPSENNDDGWNNLLNERLSKLELNYREREMVSNEDRKEINQLRGRVAQLEDSIAHVVVTNTENGDVINKSMNKRPARLLPASIL